MFIQYSFILEKHFSQTALMLMPVSVFAVHSRTTAHFLPLYTCVSNCTKIHKYPVFSARYSVMCKVYTGYHGTSEIEHGLCACTVDNPLAKARGLSLRTGAQTLLYLSLYGATRHLMIMGNPVLSPVLSLKLGHNRNL